MNDRKKLFLLPFIALILLNLPVMPAFSQAPTAGDCLGAIPVCQDVYYEPNIFSGTGTYPNEIPNCSPSNCTTCCPNNCLDGEWNSAWYIFTVQTGGLLSFTIQPDVTSDDYDWAVFNLTDNRCEEIYSLVNSLQVSCNAAGISNTTGMSSLMGGSLDCNICGTSGTNKWNADLLVLAGQTLVLYVSNWGSGAQGGFTLDFSESTAVIYDDVPPSMASVEADQVSGCSETDITLFFSENVTCSGVSSYLFTIEGPGGPYQVVETYGAACSVGGEWEKEFVLTVDHPFSSNGTYTIYMDAGFPGVQDACNNVAPPDTLTFVLDLGGPTVDESGLQISDATCGMDNGSITGLTANGTTSLSYVWKDSQGAILGYLLDLVDVPAETYTLEVYDQNDCITYAGPYTIAELGAPEIDDSGISITSSNYGASNGSITGIEISSTYTIAGYVWEDENNVVVGNSLDLTGVPTGYYDLTVIDENTCEAHAGPYFVGEIGGPLSANPSANPNILCKGESATLAPGAGGGSGSYTYTWTSTPAGFSSTLQNPVVAPEVSTTYHVQVNDGYISVDGDVDVTVLALPVPDAGSDQSIPHGTSTLLNGSASAGSGEYHYNWTPVDKLVDATVAEPQTKNIYETTPFFLMVEDAQTGCVSESPDETTVNITGGILSTNPSSSPDSVFCLGETIWLHANAGGGSGDYTYTWTSEPPISLPTVSSFSLEIQEAGTYFFYVKVNDGYNESFGYVEVRVDPAPVINLGSSIQTYCVFDTIMLDAGNPGSSYLWSNGDTSQTVMVGTTGLTYDPQDWSVTVINDEGCQADTSVSVIFDYDACVGISELNAPFDVRIYPNPSPGKVTLEIDEIFDPVRLDGYSVAGERMFTEMLDPSGDGSLKADIDLSYLSAGIYYIRLENKEGSLVSKLILK